MQDTSGVRVGEGENISKPTVVESKEEEKTSPEEQRWLHRGDQ